MRQVCTICQHPNRSAIDAVLAQRLTTKHSFSHLAERFTISRSALFRHDADHHWTQPLECQAPQAPVLAGPVLSGKLQDHATHTPKLDTEGLKKVMVARWKGKEQEILEALTPDKIKAMGGRDLSVAAGIAADKVMKLTGLDRQESDGLILRVPSQLLDKFMLAVQLQSRPAPATTVALNNRGKDIPL